MREMLTKKDKRRIDLINLLFSQTNWLRVEEIMKVLSCSEKTVLDDVQYMNSYFEDEEIVLRNPRKGIMLQPDSTKKLNELSGYILRGSRNFVLLEDLFFHPYKTTDYWRKRYYLSESSLYRVIGEILSKNQEIGLKIERSPFAIYSKNEIWLRNFFAEFFEESYEENWPFEFVDQLVIVDFFIKLSGKLTIDLSLAQMFHLSYITAVTLLRMNQGFTLTEELLNTPDTWSEKLLLSFEPEIAKMLDFQLPEKWYKEIARTVFHNEFGFKDEIEKNRVNASVLKCITSIEEDYALELDAREKKNMVFLVSNVYTGFKRYGQYRFSLFQSYHVYAKRISDEYPLFCAEVKKHLEIMEQELSFPFLTKVYEQVLTYIFTSWGGLVEQLEKKRQKCNVLVISSFGESHARTLIDSLYGNDKTNVNFEVVTKAMMTDIIHQSLDFSPYDMIVSNIWLEYLPKDRVYMLDILPTYFQAYAVRQEIKRLRSWQGETEVTTEENVGAESNS